MSQWGDPLETSKKYILGNLWRATRKMEEARRELQEAVRKIVELKEKGDDLAEDALKLLSDLAALEDMESGVTA